MILIKLDLPVSGIKLNKVNAIISPFVISPSSVIDGDLGLDEVLDDEVSDFVVENIPPYNFLLFRWVLFFKFFLLFNI